MASERILFVDDDPVARRTFARVMRERGFVVDLASDGEEAWELATHFPYAVVATDLSMPGMTGLMLIEQIREVQSDTVCLLVTGSAQTSTRKKAEEADVDVIFKPWSVEQLARALRHAVEEHRQRLARVRESDYPAAQADCVLLYGFDEAATSKLDKLLGPRYQVTSYAEPDRQRPAPCNRAATCCFVADDPRSRAWLWALSEVYPRAARIAVGRGDAPGSAARALQDGAHDWVALERLTEADLERVIELATARVAAENATPASASRPNMLSVQARVQEAIGRAVRHSRGVGVLWISLEHFGDVYTALGYQGCEDVLGLVAGRLRGAVREGDAVVRCAQDAFAVILEDLDEGTNIAVAAERVRQAFTAPFSVDLADVLLSAQVGSVDYPGDARDAAELLRLARVAGHAPNADAPGGASETPEARTPEARTPEARLASRPSLSA